MSQEFLYNEIKKIHEEIDYIKQNYIHKAYIPYIVKLSYLNKIFYDTVNQSCAFPIIKNCEDTINRLINSNASIVRFGDGEFTVMSGGSIPFQKFDRQLSDKLKSIFYEDIEGLLTGYFDLYYEMSINLKFEAIDFILKYLPRIHDYILKNYINPQKKYYSTMISMPFTSYHFYDFDRHYNMLKKIWNNMDIKLITCKNVIDKIKI